MEFLVFHYRDAAGKRVSVKMPVPAELINDVDACVQASRAAQDVAASTEGVTMPLDWQTTGRDHVINEDVLKIDA